jgi:hypothetical protein
VHQKTASAIHYIIYIGDYLLWTLAVSNYKLQLYQNVYGGAIAGEIETTLTSEM